MDDIDFSTVFTDVDAANESIREYQPDWYDGKKVNEVGFCREFLEEYPMICVKGSFFTTEGRIADEDALGKLIYDKLCTWVKTGLPRRVDSLMNTLLKDQISSMFSKEELDTAVVVQFTDPSGTTTQY